MLQISDFDYSLPKELIAQYPAREREMARLLVLDRRKKTIEHRVFKDIDEYFSRGDAVILNDTKVLTCRLKGARPSGGKLEVLLLGSEDGKTFNAFIKPRRVKVGEKVTFGENALIGIVSGLNKITFEGVDTEEIYKNGSMPLPPYIKREPQDIDNIYYQTVYARHNGAVAAPTAGLHFTEELLAKLDSQGVNIAYLTLHVGPGTFRPVRSGDIREHKMESEYFSIPETTRKLLVNLRLTNNKVCAVGTTSLRALESYVLNGHSGHTDLFIYPGYEFRIVDMLITNFHLPKTTLFMLVCAFAGLNLTKRAYDEAIRNKYRFYSYGDAMLII